MIGPLIDMKVRRTSDALKKGAKIVNGGKRADRQHEGEAAISSSS
jgi:hypothetical protein